MIPYLCLNLILVSLWLLSESRKTHYRIQIGRKFIIKEKELNKLLCVSLIAVFMGLRGEFTSDYSNYCELFSETIRRSVFDILTNRVYTETGFLIFCKLVGTITSNPNIFMFIEAVLFVSIVAWSADKYVDNAFLLFIILFVNAGIYFLSYNMLRQALAAAVIFYALHLLGSGNVKGYIVVVLFATTIHTSSLVMLAVFPLLVQKINFVNDIKMMALGVVTVLTLGKVIEFVQRFRYADYNYGMEQGTVNAFVVQWTICALIVIAIQKGTINIEDKQNIVLINSMWLYIIFSVTALAVYQMSRICYFFSTPMLLLASKIIEKMKGKNGSLIKFGVVTVLVLYNYVWLSGTGYDPYYTFLQK